MAFSATGPIVSGNIMLMLASLGLRGVSALAMVIAQRRRSDIVERRGGLRQVVPQWFVKQLRRQ